MTKRHFLFGFSIMAVLTLIGFKAFASFGQYPGAFGIMSGIQQIGVGGPSVTPTWPLEVGGTWTANPSGAAMGVSIYPTLMASASSGALTAVSITPTYSVGSFPSNAAVSLSVKNGSIFLGGVVTTTGGAVLATPGTIPTCALANRGMLFVSQGGVGVTDTLEACLKAAANTYSWISVTTGG